MVFLFFYEEPLSMLKCLSLQLSPFTSLDNLDPLLLLVLPHVETLNV